MNALQKKNDNFLGYIKIEKFQHKEHNEEDDYKSRGSV